MRKGGKFEEHEMDHRSVGDLVESFKLLSLSSPAVAPKDSVTRRSIGRELSPASLAEEGAAELAHVRRKKDFKSLERVKGRLINVLEGLELHTGVFSPAEQRRIVDCVYDFQEKGRRGLLRERTYSEPRKWMKGKGRITIQFGCCYNYAVDKNGNPPGIIRDEEVDPIPPLLKQMIKRLVAWHVLPPTCIPNSCIVNIYDKDDCIPPHIDHHDFVRPFCTVSFLSECDIVFGAELKIIGPGEFSGSATIRLPLGSVLVLNGNGADVAKHCVPAVPAKRVSITFRKMDDTKLPFKFKSDADLQNLLPISLRASSQPCILPVKQTSPHSSPSPMVTRPQTAKEENMQESPTSQTPALLSEDDFPPLSASTRCRRSR
ncbi:hypothetical protein HPP92_000697 [Vanilla planifolia]|uniref:Fe2OG dioxygenase domain-containing protein n=1 Tax=Vanilla planifolia TaxID=51239 RepID=A0A835S5B6_VANPL|nr:hypothetical protein HPP92_000697 [Vanilla planifolia]